MQQTAIFPQSQPLFCPTKYFLRVHTGAVAGAMGTGASVGGGGSAFASNGVRRFQFKLDGALHIVAVGTRTTPENPQWTVHLNGVRLQQSEQKVVLDRNVHSLDSPVARELFFELPNTKHILYVYEDITGARRGVPVLRINNRVCARLRWSPSFDFVTSSAVCYCTYK